MKHFDDPELIRIGEKKRQDVLPEKFLEIT